MNAENCGRGVACWLNSLWRYYSGRLGMRRRSFSHCSLASLCSGLSGPLLARCCTLRHCKLRRGVLHVAVHVEHVRSFSGFIHRRSMCAAIEGHTLQFNHTYMYLARLICISWSHRGVKCDTESVGSSKGSRATQRPSLIF